MVQETYKPGDCLPPDATLDQEVAQTTAEIFITKYFMEHKKKAGGFYWREIIDRVINQPGCVGLRFYHGKINDERMIVISGVDVEPATNDYKAMIPVKGENDFILAGNPIRLSEADEGVPIEILDQDISEEYLDESKIAVASAKAKKRKRDPHARKLLKKFRDEHKNEKHGGFFWKQAIDQILSQPGCIGIRYYFGINNSNQLEIILYGVNATFHDIKS